MNNGLPDPVRIPIDRACAVVRGVWRIACAAAIFGLLVVWQFDWPLLWRTQAATCLALATLQSILAIAGLVLFFTSVRWFLLACWPASMGMEIAVQGITLNAGPFGRAVYDWERIRIGFDQEVDWEIIDQMPDDAFMPYLRHPDCNEDIALRIQRLGGLEAEQMTAMLRPFLKWKSANGAAVDGAGGS